MYQQIVVRKWKNSMRFTFYGCSWLLFFHIKMCTLHFFQFPETCFSDITRLPFSSCHVNITVSLSTEKAIFFSRFSLSLIFKNLLSWKFIDLYLLYVWIKQFQLQILKLSSVTVTRNMKLLMILQINGLENRLKRELWNE